MDLTEITCVFVCVCVVVCVCVCVDWIHMA